MPAPRRLLHAKKKTVGVLEPGIEKVEDWLGIDNLYIDITADEVPILDGSADDGGSMRNASAHSDTVSREGGAKIFTSTRVTAIEPGSEVDTLLNTGGRSTEFSAAVVPADPAKDVQRAHVATLAFEFCRIMPTAELTVVDSLELAAMAATELFPTLPVVHWTTRCGGVLSTCTA